ncbi:MAG: hypothetical protein ACE5FN_08385 [Leptospirillia bacterium]
MKSALGSSVAARLGQAGTEGALDAALSAGDLFQDQTAQGVPPGEAAKTSALGSLGTAVINRQAGNVAPLSNPLAEELLREAAGKTTMEVYRELLDQKRLRRGY